MKLRKFRTNRWLWCVASLAVFIAIAASVRLPIKGENVLVVRRMFEIVSHLISGQEELGSLVSVGFWLAIWGLVSATVGWFIQSVVVLVISSRDESSKSSG